ncbi:MAG: response regulator, partial [Oscillospiraceae bacterium]|nr:response regulator [Oscillospiraceae bacterium]
MIRIVLADDREEIRDYICEIIAGEHGLMEVVGAAADSLEAIRLVDRLLPDVVLMDVQMETRTAGIDAIEVIRGSHP